MTSAFHSTNHTEMIDLGNDSFWSKNTFVQVSFVWDTSPMSEEEPLYLVFSLVQEACAALSLES